MKRPRPEPGTETKREIRVRVCSNCGYAVSETGLCSDECGNDGDHAFAAGTCFYAIYERTDKFLRDEGFDAR